MARVVTVEELGGLYRDALCLLLQSSLEPPPILNLILDPTGWIFVWVQEHPDDARGIATQLRDLINRYLEE